jgi:hypothetical protein
VRSFLWTDFELSFGTDIHRVRIAGWSSIRLCLPTPRENAAKENKKNQNAVPLDITHSSPGQARVFERAALGILAKNPAGLCEAARLSAVALR